MPYIMFMKKSFWALLLVSSLAFAGTRDTPFFEEVVTYLAGDPLEGRRVGTAGNEASTVYLEQQLQSFGFEPLGDQFRQSFTIFTEMIKEGTNEIRTSDGAVAREFQPISFSMSGDLVGLPMVFVGYGISIPEHDEKIKYDDYAGLDVTDKIVVAFTGDPAIGNPQSPFRDPDYFSYRSAHYKMKNAIAHNAKGFILIQDPMSLEGYPMEAPPYFNATEGGGERFNVVAGQVSNQWINSQWGAKDTLALQRQISQTQKPASFEVPEKHFDLSVHLIKKTGRVSNVAAILPGQDELLKKEVVVIGGHFDHLGLGGESSMDPVPGQIHHGADDNASGTAMVLKLAKEMGSQKWRRTYVFVLFNAEEVGLLGSANFVDTWAQYENAYGKIVEMLNYDMVGRYSKEVSVMGAGTGLEWKTLLDPMRSPLTFVVKDDALGSSDHASFIRQKIPSLFFTTGAHPDYHTSHDTADKVNYDAMRSIESYSLDLVRTMDATLTVNYNPDYHDGSGGDHHTGYGAHLGCVPDFGQGSDIRGVTCTRASIDSPAEKAGIIEGDILVRIGDIEIASVYDLAFALKYYRAGDQVEIAWMRHGVKMTAVIVLTKSPRG